MEDIAEFAGLIGMVIVGILLMLLYQSKEREKDG